MPAYPKPPCPATPEHCRAVIVRAVEDFGGLDILVNYAAEPWAGFALAQRCPARRLSAAGLLMEASRPRARVVRFRNATR
jgi:hypothetical protein